MSLGGGPSCGGAGRLCYMIVWLYGPRSAASAWARDYLLQLLSV